jgi:hypothetical protein
MQQGSQSTSPPTTPLAPVIYPEDVPSLDILLDLAKERVKEENEQISTLDTKAGFALGSASLLTAGVAAFQQTVFEVSRSLFAENRTLPDWARWVIVILAGIALGFYLFWCIRVIRLTRYASFRRLLR